MSVSKLTLTKQASFISTWPHHYIWDNILFFSHEADINIYNKNTNTFVILLFISVLGTRPLKLRNVYSFSPQLNFEISLANVVPCLTEKKSYLVTVCRSEIPWIENHLDTMPLRKENLLQFLCNTMKQIIWHCVGI